MSIALSTRSSLRAVRLAIIFSILLFNLGGTLRNVRAQESDPDEEQIQEITGRIPPGVASFYLLPDLKEGQTVYVYMEATNGDLDPFVGLLTADQNIQEVRVQALNEVAEVLDSGLDILAELERIYNEYYLAWDDDSGEGYSASMQFVVPIDDTYLLAVGGALSGLGRQTSGDYRLLIGLDAPQVLSGEGVPSGQMIAVRDKSTQENIAVQEITGELGEGKNLRRITLSDMEDGDTLYVYLEPTSGDLIPSVTLYDFGDKPVASGNVLGNQEVATTQYTFSEESKNYVLEISSCCEEKGPTSGEYRLLVGVNAPEVLSGKAIPIGDTVLRMPIEVNVGIKLQQITNVDQKSENFGAVVSLIMEWNDPVQAFNPDECDCRLKVYTAGTFNDFKKAIGNRWPEFTLFNQQGNRWIQNQVAVVYATGDVTYFERFTTDFQAPDFNFKKFPFDTQQFYIRVDAIYPEDTFIYSDMPGFTEVGTQLGEEEWYVTDYNTEVSREVANTGDFSSRYSFGFLAQRHLDYYLFRIFLPILLILLVSWITFFMREFGKRVDVTAGNLLLFVAFNFTISNDLPRLGYLTFLDMILIATFVITVVVLIYNVFLKRLEVSGKEELAHRIDSFGVWVYPFFYIAAVLIVVFVFF